ncbi:MAG: lysylphosphatidylglycerol synthase transmembrane domain-containing protein [Acidimicrobiales bacterium]
MAVPVKDNPVKNALVRYFSSDDKEPGLAVLSAMVSVGLVLSVGALAAITVDVGWHSLWRVLENADWTFALYIPVAVAVSYLGYTIAYREVANAEECDLSFVETLRLVTSGFGPLSPRGGYSIDVRELTKRGIDRDTARQRVRVLGLLEYAVLAPATLVAAVYMQVEGLKAQSGLVPSWIIGVPLGTIIAVCLLLRYHWRGRPTTWWSPLRNNLDAIDDLLALLKSGRRTPTAAFGMLLYWAGEIAALGLCIDIFGHRRGAIAVITVGYATGYALARRALPLAGAGVVEGLMPFALTWVGFPLAASVLAVIAYRVFNLWLPMIPAVISLRHLEGPDRQQALER